MMLYVKENEHKDMAFVCQDVDRVCKIVKVFYSWDKAEEYILGNEVLGGLYGDV